MYLCISLDQILLNNHLVRKGNNCFLWLRQRAVLLEQYCFCFDTANGFLPLLLLTSSVVELLLEQRVASAAPFSLMPEKKSRVRNGLLPKHQHLYRCCASCCSGLCCCTSERLCIAAATSMAISKRRQTSCAPLQSHALLPTASAVSGATGSVAATKLC